MPITKERAVAVAGDYQAKRSSRRGYELIDLVPQCVRKRVASKRSGDGITEMSSACVSMCRPLSETVVTSAYIRTSAP